jgi:GTP-binding protein HflX
VKKGFQATPQDKLVERAYLVGVSLPDSSIAKEREHLDELAALATTAGAVVVGSSVQGRTRIDGATFIGTGKASRVKEECERLNANLIIFDNDLSPAQARNLEEILGINVIDRTELILDIFARHAKSQQAKIQVELARLVYTLPRLRRLWGHLSRQQGGIGTRGGPGETQLEIDRRRVRERIAHLKRQLERISRRRDLLRKSRNGLPVVAVVGYTNTGKSTLMNAMTSAATLAENQLFATLDTLTRKLENKNHAPVLVVDTVGFIRKLPHHLVESFKATLADIAEADLWLHVIDAAHPGFTEQMEIADQTLQSINESRVRTLYVFNKIDAVDPDTLDGLRKRYPEAVFVSAKRLIGIDELEGRIHETLLGRILRVEVRISVSDGKGIAQVKSLVKEPKSSLEDGVCVLEGTIQSGLADRLERISGVRVRYLL